MAIVLEFTTKDTNGSVYSLSNWERISYLDRFKTMEVFLELAGNAPESCRSGAEISFGGDHSTPHKFSSSEVLI